MTHHTGGSNLIKQSWWYCQTVRLSTVCARVRECVVFQKFQKFQKQTKQDEIGPRGVCVTCVCVCVCARVCSGCPAICSTWSSPISSN